MEPWYNVFSYWGFILWILSPLLPFSVLAILILNLIGTFLFLSASRTSFSVAMFLILIHAVPVWFARRQPMQWVPTFAVFATYLAFLAVQGLSFTSVYESLIREPPVTIREYLKLRGIYTTRNAPPSIVQ
jgi:hypothetical protein